MGNDRGSQVHVSTICLAAAVAALFFLPLSVAGSAAAVPGEVMNGQGTAAFPQLMPAGFDGLLVGTAVSAVTDPVSLPEDIPGNVLRFFAGPFLQFIFPEPEPVVGIWNISATSLEMEFYNNGTAVVRYPDSGNYAPGHWERAGAYRYRIWSAPGSTKTVLVFNPIADSLHSEDFTVILNRRGEVQ